MLFCTIMSEISLVKYFAIQEIMYLCTVDNHRDSTTDIRTDTFRKRHTALSFREVPTERACHLTIQL